MHYVGIKGIDITVLGIPGTKGVMYYIVIKGIDITEYYGIRDIKGIRYYRWN